MALAAGITAAAALLGQGIGAYSAGRMNKRAERFARETYKNQRRDALSDWNMQNAYNDPSAQMQRLKNAGLNPNLVYGNGATATAESAPRGSNRPQPSYETPKMDLGSVALQAMQMKQLEAGIARTEAETNRINADTQAMLYNNQFLTPEMFSTEYEHRKDKALYGSSKEHTSAQIQKLQSETAALMAGYSKTHDPLQRSDTKRRNPNLSVSKALAQIENIIKNTSGQELSNQLKEYETKLIKSFGVSGNHAATIMSNLLKLFMFKR